MRLILVEADPLLRTGYALCLLNEGWRVDAFGRARAEDLLRQRQDVIVLDANLVGGDGQPLWLAVAPELRTPLIVLALSPEQEEALRRAPYDNVFHLVKPFSLRRLVHLIRAVTAYREVA